MAKPQTAHIQTQLGEKVRIGPISLITLIIVICMAVLGVLAASTSHATQTISERQANASQQMYLNEKAGQELVADIDAVLVNQRATGASATRAAARAGLGGSPTGAAAQQGRQPGRGKAR